MERLVVGQAATLHAQFPYLSKVARVRDSRFLFFFYDLEPKLPYQSGNGRA